MFDSLRVRVMQGYQAIPDVKAAVVRAPFRGFPLIAEGDCGSCAKCTEVCPSRAILSRPVRVDMGRCVFCGECERVCPQHLICFSNFHKTSTTVRERLIVGPGVTPEIFCRDAVEANVAIGQIFGRSLALRQVSAAGCNGCEMEINACSNVNFDMGRFGLNIVASPRHADGLLITGPISVNMAAALDDAFHSVPDPKIVVLAGACAIDGGVFAESPALDRSFLEKYKVDLYVPGCPVHPLTVVNGILSLLR